MRRVRTFARAVHLWLGLVVGALLALMGLTGAALVFYIEIDGALHPAVSASSSGSGPGWSSPIWDRAMATARSRWPDPAGSWSLEATGRAGPVPARYYPPAGHAGHSHHDAREMIWFSADGRRVIRADPWGSYAMSWLYELHANLQAKELGRQIAGWSGFAAILLLASGIVAWWPRAGWHKAIAFKRGAAPLRRLHDVHKLAGLWSALPLALLAVTGSLLALPDVRALLLAPAMAPAPRSHAASGKQVPLSLALAAAHRAVPGGRLSFIDVPGSGDGVFRMRVQVPGDPHRRFPGSFVYVDQYSARVLAVHDIRTAGGGTILSAWVRGLHDGSAGGTAGRIVAIIAGLAPATLLCTGLLHWRRRRKARARRTASQKLQQE